MKDHRGFVKGVGVGILFGLSGILMLGQGWRETAEPEIIGLTSYETDEYHVAIAWEYDKGKNALVAAARGFEVIGRVPSVDYATPMAFWPKQPADILPPQKQR